MFFVFFFFFFFSNDCIIMKSIINEIIGQIIGLQQYIAIRKYWDTDAAIDNTLYCIGGTWFAVLQYGHLMGSFLKEIYLDIFKP